MKAFLLTVALLLMGAALSTPLWVPRTSSTSATWSRKAVVAGRIKGDFPDAPWTGMLLFLGPERVALRSDGKFSFSVMPGTHILKICCSDRFQQIYREIEVEDRDLYFELEARPLVKVEGKLSTPDEKPLNEPQPRLFDVVHRNRPPLSRYNARCTRHAMCTNHGGGCLGGRVAASLML